jgi:hypothetical protein
VYWDEEIKELKENEIPVHCFYIEDRAKKDFTEMADGNNATC